MARLLSSERFGLSRPRVAPTVWRSVRAQAALLERNVSPKVTAEYKRIAITNVGELARMVRERVPELAEHDAVRFAGATVMVTGATWTHSQPSAAMLAVYETDPEPAAMRLDFTDTLRQLLEVLLTGLLARASG
ncbi:hypothetical protein G3I60_00460 [Streptomyces sp. SID13666]|nr:MULTISPECIES: hypothetical protein [unclassified Streptomyces]NEA52684.1 hypothetical protein [Streptomyces sp. SID13666]NEA69989.1 hypothetical protein [Streptomyces sp. SID13588]